MPPDARDGKSSDQRGREPGGYSQNCAAERPGSSKVDPGVDFECDLETFDMSMSQDQHHRALRAAANESRFREINERIERANDGFAFAFSVEAWICECSNESCAERLQLSVEEYEGIRSDGARFLVAPHEAHVWLEIEEVIAHCDRYWVVEKKGEAAERAERADPREH
jgi:hypothetical protein